MELRHLRSFVLVAETASFSVADSRCYLSKSVKSTQHNEYMKVIEEKMEAEMEVQGGENE